MKCQILFSGKNKKNINLLSVENAEGVVKVKFCSSLSFYCNPYMYMYIYILTEVFPLIW